ncbi:MAG: hypothetical protein ACRCVW_03790 [Brevinema sp.]
MFFFNIRNLFKTKKEKKALKEGYQLCIIKDQNQRFLFKTPKYIDVENFINLVYRSKKEITLLEIDFIDFLFVGHNQQEFFNYLSADPSRIKDVLYTLCDKFGIDTEVESDDVA